jgi:acyl-CoA thioesterase-1
VLREKFAANILEGTIQVYVDVMVAVSVSLLLVPAVFATWRKRHPRFPAVPADEMSVVCASDSLTAGSLSANYLIALKRRLPRHQFVNAGRNGDTAAGLLKRVDHLLALNPTAVAILIGTNDVHRTEGVEAYEQNLRAILNKLNHKRVAVLSIPPLGEQPESEINLQVRTWNAAVREITYEYGVVYLPLFERLLATFTKPGKPFRLSIGLILVAAIRHNVLRQSFDHIAALNGFSILTDSVHPSERGADVIAELIAAWLAND